MKKFYIKTYGCQMNQYDAGLVQAILENAGFISTNDVKKADIVLLLTCAVREHAEKRALGQIMSYQRLRKKKENLLIGVLGCMAKTLSLKLKSELNSRAVNLLVGPNNYHALPALIKKEIATSSCQIVTEDSDELYDELFPKIAHKGISAFVTIVRGCDNYCSYCIVPYVRGRERCRSLTSIFKEIELLAEAGIKEVTLLGQNVLAYQNHKQEPADDGFLNLLEKVSEIPGIERIRFLTCHPKDFSFPFIEKFASLIKKGKVCPEVHLPLQSGSNRILQLMNRKYTREEYLKKVNFLKDLIPDTNLSTDLMVGFPTEEEKDYELTLEMVKEIEFDFAYMFKYSERPYTKATSLYPKVDPKISQKRLEKLIEIQNEITKKKAEKMIGHNYEILVEKTEKSQSFGKTKQGKLVCVDEPLTIGQKYLVRIEKVVGWTPKGQCI